MHCYDIVPMHCNVQLSVVNQRYHMLHGCSQVGQFVNQFIAMISYQCQLSVVCNGIIRWMLSGSTSGEVNQCLAMISCQCPTNVQLSIVNQRYHMLHRCSQVGSTSGEGLCKASRILSGLGRRKPLRCPRWLHWRGNKAETTKAYSIFICQSVPTPPQALIEHVLVRWASLSASRMSGGRNFSWKRRPELNSSAGLD